MKMKKIIILGGGGHAKVLIELIKASGQYNIAGIVDTNIAEGTIISGIPVLGRDELLPELYKKNIKNICIAVGSVKDNTKRKRLYDKAKEIGFNIECLIHPKAVVSKESRISDGAQIMAGVIVQTGAAIGENTIINTGAIIDHDCDIGKNAHICPGVVISGGVKVGDGSFIGAGSTIIQGIRIGKDVIVAAGSVVIKDAADGKTVKGVPAK
ncbi:MAG: acetyltransferase [bacterium]|nr:acetyltransferase [bacterium]